MKRIAYSLTLLSDAAVGTGFGTVSVNQTVARDHEGRPIIPSTHLKGVVRDFLGRLASELGWSDDFEDAVLGAEGDGHGDGTASSVRFSSAQLESGGGGIALSPVRAITRTRLSDLGTAASGSLRTTEAVRAGARFRGEIFVADHAPPQVEAAVRLALLSLDALGGGRNRGAGACCVVVDGETRRPGDLLRALAPDAPKFKAALGRPQAGRTQGVDMGVGTTLLRLVFQAADPVCCPETPVVSNNLLRSGLGIPASAVLGAAISRLDAFNSDLATAALADRRTLAWPLLPCGGTDLDLQKAPAAVRVSLSHRMSKLQGARGEHEFRDAAIEPYDWRTVADGSPLKASDGVLIKSDGAPVELWRSSDMPRLVTAHGVHFPARNLFTVESFAPLTYTGWIALPSAAAERFVRSLQENPSVAFGKARTVRGGGVLVASPAGPADFAAIEHNSADLAGRVFVLQSPAAIPDDWEVGRAETVLQRLAAASGFGDVDLQDEESGLAHVGSLASCAVRFGWSRHGVGRGIADSRRLRARRVILPGSVFVLRKRVADMPRALMRGLGVELANGDMDGREQGFGAVLPHPGIAGLRRVQEPKLQRIPASDGAAKLAFELHDAARAGSPSVSQIAALRDRIPENARAAADAAAARDYFNNQCDGRSARVWERWKAVNRIIHDSLRDRPGTLRRALRIWQDLVLSFGTGEEA